MSWWSALVDLFTPTRLPDPPGYDYFWWLHNYPYELGVLDCSNKSAAYFFYLQSLQVECKLAHVQMRNDRNRTHALVWAVVDEQTLYLDPTNGTWGWWEGQQQFDFLSFIDVISPSSTQWSTDGISHADFSTTV